MRGLLVDAYKPSATITEGELPEPVTGPHDVVLAVGASELGFPDTLQIEGRYQLKAPLPFAPGMAAAGRVIARGALVTTPAVGDRVLALVDHGAHAQFLAAPAAWCFPVPDSIDDATAAALGLVYQTAWFALQDRAQLNAQDRVLVLGARGGVGMAAVQLAKALGAGMVIAATRGDDDILPPIFGADHVVNAADPETLRRDVLALTDGAGVDIVIDPVGGATAEAALRCLGWRGRLVVVGFASGEVPKFKANHLLVKNIAICGLQWTDYRARQCDAVAAAQARIFDFCAQGAITPQIVARLGYGQAGDAYARLQSGRAGGKIILHP